MLSLSATDFPSFAALMFFLARHLASFATAASSNPDAPAPVSRVPNFRIVIISVIAFLTLIALIFGLPYITRRQTARSPEAFELTSFRRNADSPQRRRHDTGAARLSVQRPSAGLQGGRFSPVDHAVQSHNSPVTNGDGRPIPRPALAPPAPALTADVIRTHGGALSGIDGTIEQPLATSSCAVSGTDVPLDVSQSLAL